MANRNFNRQQALEREVKSLFADVAIGAAGAPTLSRGLGVESVVRDSAGVYIITLQDKYQRLLSAKVMHVVAAVEDLSWQMEAEDVASAKTVTVRAQVGGVETDPSSGSRLLIELLVKNSSQDE